LARSVSAMNGVSENRSTYRFGPFELDTSEGVLSRNGNRVKLQDLPYRLLVTLLERPGEIVSREEVRQRLWPENTFVEFDNSLGVAVRKIRDSLGDDAEAPRYVETLPRRGYRFLAPVTVLPIENVKSSAQTNSPPATGSAYASERDFSSGHRRRIYLSAAVVAALLLGTAVYEFRSFQHRFGHKADEIQVHPPVHVRRAVAVMGFRNLPGAPQDNWLSNAFAEMLSTELSADSNLRMVSGEDVSRAKRDFPLADEDSLAKPTLLRLHSDPGADVVVLGSYTPLPGKGEKRIRLDVRLQDTTSGETIAEQAFVGKEEDLFELVAQAGTSLRERLGSRSVSAEVFAEVQAALPTSPAAIKLYTEGQSRLWAFDLMGARDLLAQAVAAEPDFPLSHAALADALCLLGYTLKCRDEIDRARSLSQHLGEEDRLLVQGQYYAFSQNSAKAVVVYEKLFTEFPDNLDYGLRLADEQRRVSPEDAVKTLESLRHLPPPIGDDPRIDMLEARTWINRDFVKAESIARRAVQKGAKLGSRLLVARAYGILCQLTGIGTSTEQAIQDCQNAERSSAEAGNHDGEARTLNDFAGLYYQLGDMSRAEAMFRKALGMFRQVGDLEGVTAASGNLGGIFLASGNLAEASRAFAEALPGYKESGDKDGTALVLNNLAEVARLRGDLETSLGTYHRAKVTAQEIDDKRAVAYVLNGIGEVLLDQGDFSGARKSFQEALSIREQIGENQARAETELALAQLSIEENHAADSEPAIRKCEEQFRQDKQLDDELAAHVALINALLAEHKYSEAGTEAEQSKPIAAKSADEILRLRFDLVNARSELASDSLKPGRELLESTLRKAHEYHLLGVEFESRLAIAESKQSSGQRTAPTAESKKHARQFVAVQTESFALEKAARKAGFILIASKAVSLRKGYE
jgi:eukaryotic-like serine/threonine-protein kinase